MPASSRNLSAWALLLLGLGLSGVAGIVNQVVWQRALRVFLSGSETLSAMIVVVVFLGGLGLGAAWASRVRTQRPLLALALVELGLALVNAVVMLVLGLDITDFVYGAQRLAVGAGIPIRAVYMVGALLLLLPPTLLMGATVPFASAGCQRQLGASSDRLLPVLFFVNTVGAAAGALGASLWLLPWYGQRQALLLAIGCNALAGLLFAVLSPRPAEPVKEATALPKGRLRPEEILGLCLGFLSLSYEMLLLRALTLSHEPRPETFAVALCSFLVSWSVGVALAGRARTPVGPVALAVGAGLALMPAVHTLIRYRALLDLLPTALLLCLPVVGFGLLYGVLVRQVASDWGRDVGRFSALNTVGSCLGVLLFTLVGFEAPLWHGAMALAAGTAAVGLLSMRRWGLQVAGAVLVVLSLGLLGWGLSRPYTVHEDEIAWWGRDGVVELVPNGDVYIDGLWHTRLSDGQDHIGEPYSWTMAMAAVLARGEHPLERALVIGAGVGISGVTLAGVEGLRVDGYEINHTLQPLLRAYPEKTLHSLEHPALRWIWQDARTGLALDETRYDLILSAPLHLRAAGSSLLLSKEYLRLVKSRLNEGGVIAVYANEGVDAQALLVQRTLAEVFAHRATWYDGIVTVASDAPLPDVTAELLAERMRRGDRLGEEMALYDAQLKAEGEAGLISRYDGPASKMVADRPIVDDHPLLEYPEVAAALVQPVPAGSVR